MCVTADPAVIYGTETYVYPTELDGTPVHVSGYQNMAESSSGGNCMFLNFAGSNLQMVDGPQRTRNLMRDMTASLEELVYVEQMRGGSFRGSKGITVVNYGNYTAILAQGPGDMLSVLDQVPADRRPVRSQRLEEMIDFYMRWYPQDSFVLACFKGSVNPEHPIVVSYEPRDASVLTIPGLDGHDGQVPVIGAPVYRDFKLAFGINGIDLPIPVRYTDPNVDLSWAPSSVSGFIDNRHGLNGDYVLPIEAVMQGLNGPELAAKLIKL